MLRDYDVIVVGGGHAGNEAAAAAANLGSSVLLITMNMGTIGQMSCNPAMGGIAKGQIVREIDALGGYSGIVSDKSAIQFRMLNRSKGPAMWSPRTQNDRLIFATEWRLMLERTPGVDFWQDMVSGLLIEGEKCVGVETQMGLQIKAKSVVLTNGTFLNGLIHLGEKQFGGGRAGERAATGITAQLESLGFESGRMKTGTPPRVDGRSLNYDVMDEQPGDENPSGFSYLAQHRLTTQRSCHITYTNPTVHDILKEGFDRSPMFNGRIRGSGPRYCPSIEDKIDRFAERDRHQVFVEPEGWDTVEVYVNGFSTSLPEEIQMKAMREIPGFENARMFRPGYAVEYDYFPPTQLRHTLETKLISNLFFAGQINGTTGYEEAACQGMMAGINAHHKVNEKDPFTLQRSEAYIGVLIDDLVTKGTNEPYRMFTSRAEYRILLRQDNADERLTPLAHSLGLASDERMELVGKKQESMKSLRKYMDKTSISPEEANPVLTEKNSAPIKQKVKLSSVITRPHIDMETLANASEMFHVELSKYDPVVIESVQIMQKYEGYIAKEQEMADKMNRLENIIIPSDIEFDRLTSMSSEARQKLKDAQPGTIGQASRVSGVSPADISVLLVYLGR
ncbi:tRNA uridine-5-carboxymethylaminomethyl(34) synthesis enzyme MnmG [Sanyastnella coralliicola]|uniref:tRNA uridine-5-carboxymethylaminomethyl(34) synthesis enzyme MnmG n=1 Tax=Sanyastnella coralliicola TaxID=3069118 RepID=UPI0027B8909B|nr:tRNA uridine-5-carboxymethylaminomethyl(34) synthesis enzyme MnmG [Longitalea sp. SCSIO 12813]